MADIKIDGVDYDFLDVSTVDLDESCWFYDIAGVGPEAIEEMADGEFNPKLVKALVCLSIARVRSDVPLKEIEKRVGELKLTELADAFTQAVKESPPAEDPAPETEIAPEETPSSSGSDSSGAGERSPDEPDQAATGSPDSDTGAASVRAISAA